MSYSFPGNEYDFAREFGGLPQKGLGLVNIFLMAVVIIVIIAIVTIIIMTLSTPEEVFLDNEILNLDPLIDLNKNDVECCVFAGQSAPNEQYLFDTVGGITYSRLPPSNIQNTCNSFPNPETCVKNNTDSEGKIIPIATFKAQPYYTFEAQLFNLCDTTTSCN